jgi:nitroreductase
MFHGIDARAVRRPGHDIDDIFVNRWSPRALSGAEIPETELLTLFEAARWAPSAFNNQPWRFLYARRGDAYWDRFLGLLNEKNRGWAHAAAALVVVLSKTTFDHNGKPARTHSFDTGAAWQNLALQATARGWVAHGMQGFDAARARTELRVPEEFAVEIMVALGRPGRPEDLPDKQRAGERPNGRKPLAETVFAGGFPAVAGHD